MGVQVRLFLSDLLGVSSTTCCPKQCFGDNQPLHSSTENHCTRRHAVRILHLPREDDTEAGGARHDLPPRGKGRGALTAADHVPRHPVEPAMGFHPQRAEHVPGRRRRGKVAADSNNVPDAIRVRDGRSTQRCRDAAVC